VLRGRVFVGEAVAAARHQRGAGTQSNPPSAVRGELCWCTILPTRQLHVSSSFLQQPRARRRHATGTGLPSAPNDGTRYVSEQEQDTHVTTEPTPAAAAAAFL
jgi:hypothetical protein